MKSGSKIFGAMSCIALTGVLGVCNAVASTNTIAAWSFESAKIPQNSADSGNYINDVSNHGNPLYFWSIAWNNPSNTNLPVAALLVDESRPGSPGSYSLKLSGTNDFVHTGSPVHDSSVVGQSQNLTLGGWFKLAALADNMGLMCVWDAPTNAATCWGAPWFGVDAMANGSIRLNAVTPGLVPIKGQSARGVLTTGVWHEVSMTFSKGKLTVFVDGKQVLAADLGYNLGPQNLSYVGVAYSADGAGYTGVIDDLSLTTDTSVTP